MPSALAAACRSPGSSKQMPGGKRVAVQIRRTNMAIGSANRSIRPIRSQAARSTSGFFGSDGGVPPPGDESCSGEAEFDIRCPVDLRTTC